MRARFKAARPRCRALMELRVGWAPRMAGVTPAHVRPAVKFTTRSVESRLRAAAPRRRAGSCCCRHRRVVPAQYHASSWSLDGLDGNSFSGMTTAGRARRTEGPGPVTPAADRSPGRRVPAAAGEDRRLRGAAKAARRAERPPGPDQLRGLVRGASRVPRGDAGKAALDQVYETSLIPPPPCWTRLRSA